LDILKNVDQPDCRQASGERE